ncbi:MAG: cupin domain-containing protein [Gammaproteobacteria bacterium]|nr:cupin domain-containing protein [Gammaproteobacteria bacterium]
MKPDNIYQSIPASLNQEIFEQLVQHEQVTIERIISRGHTSPDTGWYDQDKNEWLIVLKGAATIAFENDADIHLTEGSYLNIPAHKKHKVSWTDPTTETIWLAVHY